MNNWYSSKFIQKKWQKIYIIIIELANLTEVLPHIHTTICANSSNLNFFIKDIQATFSDHILATKSKYRRPKRWITWYQLVHLVLTGCSVSQTAQTTYNNRINNTKSIDLSTFSTIQLKNKEWNTRKAKKVLGLTYLLNLISIKLMSIHRVPQHALRVQFNKPEK